VFITFLVYIAHGTFGLTFLQDTYENFGLMSLQKKFGFKLPWLFMNSQGDLA
jgi:hypothetical protein